MGSGLVHQGKQEKMRGEVEEKACLFASTVTTKYHKFWFTTKNGLNKNLSHSPKG